MFLKPTQMPRQERISEPLALPREPTIRPAATETRLVRTAFFPNQSQRTAETPARPQRSRLLRSTQACQSASFQKQCWALRELDRTLPLGPSKYRTPQVIVAETTASSTLPPKTTVPAPTRSTPLGQADLGKKRWTVLRSRADRCTPTTPAAKRWCGRCVADIVSRQQTGPAELAHEAKR